MSQSTQTPFCITDFDSVTSADVCIKRPDNGEPTDIVIQLAGPEHPERKRWEHAFSLRMRALIARNGNQMPQIDPRDEEFDNIEMLAVCTLGWTAPEGSGMPEYSRAAAQALYSDPKRQWLRKQVAAAMSNADRFIQRSAAA
jgi:hypothetical protein